MNFIPGSDQLYGSWKSNCAVIRLQDPRFEELETNGSVIADECRSSVFVGHGVTEPQELPVRGVGGVKSNKNVFNRYPTFALRACGNQ
jgi:hypothetical protein